MTNLPNTLGYYISKFFKVNDSFIKDYKIKIAKP